MDKQLVYSLNPEVKSLPLWLYCALTRKQLKQAISTRELHLNEKAKLFEHPKALKHCKKSILVRVSVWPASYSGTNFHKLEDSYTADRIFIEQLSCSKLPGKFENLQKVEGAGGVLFKSSTEDELLLLLKRDGKSLTWVLPKGKCKAGEKKRETALREVKEETGIADIKLGRLLGREAYFVPEGKAIIYKRISYYAMYLAQPDSLPKVNTLEGFVDSRWMTVQEALQLTNPSRSHSILYTLLRRKDQKR
ncbi:MAG: NUDIX domain-containing protein [Acidobacteriota bacterium]|nr:NUDIX domain-containing protein [Blastocatellia bacterium]MDW8412935.1 NUDIX domain-containing protein [Acidobacteriota bacterium]